MEEPVVGGTTTAALATTVAAAAALLQPAAAKAQHDAHAKAAHGVVEALRRRGRRG